MFPRELVERESAGLATGIGNVLWVDFSGLLLAIGHAVTGGAAPHHDHRHPLGLATPR